MEAGSREDWSGVWAVYTEMISEEWAVEGGREGVENVHRKRSLRFGRAGDVRGGK